MIYMNKCNVNTALPVKNGVVSRDKIYIGSIWLTWSMWSIKWNWNITIYHSINCNSSVFWRCYQILSQWCLIGLLGLIEGCRLTPGTQLNSGLKYVNVWNHFIPCSPRHWLTLGFSFTAAGYTRHQWKQYSLSWLEVIHYCHFLSWLGHKRLKLGLLEPFTVGQNRIIFPDNAQKPPSPSISGLPQGHD